MPPRRVKEEPQDEIFNFALSQASQASSDDNTALEMALAEKYTASKEKKKRENQQKFLAASKKHLLKELTTPVEDVQATCQSVYVLFVLLLRQTVLRECSEELVEAFVVNYATEEDNIRKIWCEIIEEERKLQSYIETCRSNNETASKTGVEDLNIKGMSRVHTVCQNYQKAIDFVKPAKISA
ncbi:hypothetical protein AAF712_003609 [Marasmius tenuissimus]|uniref:Uncharacterized protein n=1 Tax=Marasmius tenuissimus TaxID=585030 RepID=A0ABR3A5I4_9AGAR